MMLRQTAGRARRTGSTRPPFAGTAPFGAPDAIADLNADGKLDLVSSGSDSLSSSTFVVVSLGGGDGNLTPVVFTTSGFISTGVTIGDFNGDGKLDLAMPSFIFGIGNVLQVYTGNGDGTFQAAVNSPASQDFSGVVSIDLNGDGILDLVADGSCVYLGNGDGTFTEKGCSKLPAGVFVKQTAFGDFNGDGKLDMVSLGSFDNVSPFKQVVLLSLGNGNGTFKSPTQVPAGVLSITPDSFGLSIGDINNDGKLDIAVGSKNRTFLFLQK